MKRVIFLLIFCGLMGGGFYLGSTSSIANKSLSFAEVEEREPANEASNGAGFLNSLVLQDDGQLLTIALSPSAEGGESKSLCLALENGSTYQVTVDVLGVSVHSDVDGHDKSNEHCGDDVQFFIEDTCEQGQVLAFDREICAQNRQEFQFQSSPYVTRSSGVKVFACNLVNPFTRQDFAVSEITIKNDNNEVVESFAEGRLPEAVKRQFSCIQPE